MAVTVNDIIQIKAGKAESFVCDSPKQAKSGQSTVSYVKKFCADQMPADVADYETGIKGNVLTVLAIKKN
jgi:hypothetical protein